MCQYCSGEKPIFEESEYDYNNIHELSFNDLTIAIEGDKLSYQIDHFGTDDINITYCPFCGKRLAETM